MKISASPENCEPDSNPRTRLLQSYAGTEWLVELNGLPCEIEAVVPCIDDLDETKIVLTVRLKDVESLHVY